MRLKFPTQVAQRQVQYFLPKGTRMYMFDVRSQAISKITFNIGEIESFTIPEEWDYYYANRPYQPHSEEKYPVSKLYSLNNYIDMLYTVEEKTYHPSKYIENLVFSERTLSAPSPGQTTPTGQDLYKAGDKQLDDTGYTFYIDQLVYDAQLKENVFLKDNKYSLNIANDRISNASSVGTSHPIYDPVGVTISRDVFLPFAQQKTIAADIMKDKMWLKRFADKHYLAVFKSNIVDLKPRVLFGVKLEELRAHFTDDTRY